MPVPIPVISSNIILTREPVPAAANSYWYDRKAPVLVPLTHGYEIIFKKTLEPLLSNKFPRAKSTWLSAINIIRTRVPVPANIY